MKKLFPLLFVPALLCIISVKTAKAQTPAFKLANVLQSNMVVQQAKPFRVWGTAPAGQTIQITADWTSTVSVKADAQGNWIGQITVPHTTPGNFTAHTINIFNGTTTLKLTNILIGEVWLCAGQSNMDMPVEPNFLGYPGVIDYQTQINAANYPNIRLFETGAAFKIQPTADEQGNWQVCTPTNVKEFSAVAYFFARYLYLKLNIPVGVVTSALSGASCANFTSREVLQSDPVLKAKYLDPNEAAISSQSAVDANGFFTNVGLPTLGYNGVIYPLLNLSIRGFNWYQGESNVNDGSVYTLLCSKMLDGWRKDFKQGKLPFNFVQIAPYNSNATDSVSYNYALLREAQADMLKVSDSTSMAVNMDVGEVTQIHYSNKKPVGERVAKNALNNVYNIPTPHLGPAFKSYQVNGDTVKVSFTPESIGNGLATSDGKTPAQFYIAGSDMVFYYAITRIVNNQVWAGSPLVKKPVAVRYAFNNLAITNLMNKDSLPAEPFRTDRFGYTACSFAYNQTSTISSNCTGCSIVTPASGVDADTTSGSSLRIGNIPAGAYIEQQLLFQNPGLKGDVVKLGLFGAVNLTGTDILNAIEISLYNGTTLVKHYTLTSTDLKLQNVGSKRYVVIIPATANYDRVTLRLNSTAGKLTALVISYAVQQYAPVSAPNVTTCQNSPAILSITASVGNNYNWYENPVGGEPVFTGTTYTTPPLATSKTYYVSDSRNACEGDVRTPITVTVQSILAPTVTINGGDSVVVATSATLTANSPSGGTYMWYNSATGGTLLFTGTTYTTPPLYTNTSYYVEVANGCISPRTKVDIAVKPAKPDVTFFPNPSTGNITLKIPYTYNGIFQATVVTLQGKTVFQHSYNGVTPGTYTINAGGTLTNGYYILQVKGQNLSKVFKIQVVN